MKNSFTLNTGNFILGAILTLAAMNVFAYDDDKSKEMCRDPKIQEFNLPEYKAPDNREVPAEADFSFVVSSWSDPKKIKVTAKNKPVPFQVESNDSFHRVKGKIPAEFTGQFMRLNVRIPALLGCYSTQGWLLKIAGSAKPQEKPATAAPAKTDAASAPSAPANEQPKASSELNPTNAAPVEQKAAESAATPTSEKPEPAQQSTEIKPAEANTGTETAAPTSSENTKAAE